MSVVAEEIELTYRKAYLVVPEIEEHLLEWRVRKNKSQNSADYENSTAVHIFLDHALETVVVSHILCSVYLLFYFVVAKLHSFLWH